MDKLNFNKFGTISGNRFNPEELGKMKAETVNALEGHLTGFDCPKCRNKGVYAVPSGDGIIIYDCSCMKARRGLLRLERSGLKKVIDEYVFEAFVATDAWQKQVKKAAMEYTVNPEGWVLFGGQSGCGKTHLCTAICHKLLVAGCEVRYMPWRDEIAQLKAMTFDSDRRGELLHELKTMDVLYIDDFFKTGKGPDGSSDPTRADIDLAFEIINYRYINNLRTIISTEKTPAELLRIDEATAGRIIEKAKNNIYVVNNDPARNYRLKSVNEC